MDGLILNAHTHFRLMSVAMRSINELISFVKVNEAITFFSRSTSIKWRRSQENFSATAKFVYLIWKKDFLFNYFFVYIDVE